MLPCYMDMDPGIDDALALVVGVNHLTVQGVTTVAGNVALTQTFQNACGILDLVQAPQIPVVAGSREPLFASPWNAYEIHGDNGLGGYQGPKEINKRPTAEVPGWVWLASELAAVKAPIDVIATGPLTNLARLCLGFPHVLSKIRNLTIMGGSLSGGNVTSTAEFNFYVDPDAAEAVLKYVSGIRLVGLDVTHQVLWPLHDVKRLLDFGSVGRALAMMLSHYGGRRPDFAGGEGLAIHDVLAVAAAHQPEFFSWESVPLTVVREGGLRGTVVATPKAEDRAAVAVATRVRTGDFFDWLWQGLDPYLEKR